MMMELEMSFFILIEKTRKNELRMKNSIETIKNYDNFLNNYMRLFPDFWFFIVFNFETLKGKFFFSIFFYLKAKFFSKK